MVWFYVCSNYVLQAAVSWKLVFINCFLLTVGEDFVLCVLAAALAKRLMPVFSDMRADRLCSQERRRTMNRDVRIECPMRQNGS